MQTTPNRVVTSAEVEAYEGMVESHARRFDGVRGAEFDDLKQEGLIAVWEALRDGYIPSNVVVVNAMRDWVRVCAQKGLTGDEFGHDLVSRDDPLATGLVAALDGSPI